MGCTQSKSLHDFVEVAVAQSVSCVDEAEDSVQPTLPMPGMVKPAAPLADAPMGGSSAGILKMLPSLFQVKAAAMAELLAEELQREQGEKKKELKPRSLSRNGSRRRHAHGSAEEAMLVCDVLSNIWRISFGNAACADMLGVPHGDVTRYGVWDLLTSSRVMSSKGTPFSSREQATNLHSDFEVEACLKGQPEQRPAEGAEHAKLATQHMLDGSGVEGTRPYLVRLSRHPADHVTPVPGSPCSSSNSPTSSLSMFSSNTRVTTRAGWAELDSACTSSRIGAARVQQHSSAQHSSAASSSSSNTGTGSSHPTSDGSMYGTLVELAPEGGGEGGHLDRAVSLPVYRTQIFSCVTLGELLGKGAFGRVYQGSWKGATVAVKVIDVYLDPSEPDSVKNEKAYLEAIVSKATARSGPQPHQLWLVTEYCNRGSLYAAITNGRLRQRGSVSLLHVLRTAQEIAGALSYLHDREIVHRDLSSNNVLLCASGKDNRCFTIRVSDFGLSRYESTGNATTTMGTVSHMPPELLGKGVVGKFTDVYSFGILLYEMYTGKHPFEGMTPSAVVFDMAAADACPLTFPPDAPPDLTALYKACVDFKASQRPTFDDVLESLSALIEQAEQETAQVIE
ncbi:hypothetical protein N2152v2_008244 [Parachlorella kessleri]